MSGSGRGAGRELGAIIPSGGPCTEDGAGVGAGLEGRTALAGGVLAHAGGIAAGIASVASGSAAISSERRRVVGVNGRAGIAGVVVLNCLCRAVSVARRDSRSACG
jgi:hypothetical protein